MRGIGLRRPRMRPRHRGFPTIRVEPIRTAAMPPALARPAGELVGGGPVQHMPDSITPFTFESPDLIEPLTGFRSWRTDGDRLRSPYLPVYWDERLVPARCHRQATGASGVLPPHTPPYGPCGCGIHAYHEPNLDFPAVDYRGVTGIVTLRGRVAVGPEGMRAELARVEALGFYSRWSRRQKRDVSAIAERLGVDLVELDDLSDAAQDYGRPLLPHSLSRARAAEPAPLTGSRSQTGEHLTVIGRRG
jgi:hypothetical protein